MVAPTAGTVVLIPFPFSNMSNSKLRPAVVLAGVGRDDWILCQITSNPYADAQAVTITSDSFMQGSLQRTSYARPGKLFTANSQLIVAQVGVLTTETLQVIIDRVVHILHHALHTRQSSS